MTQEMTIDLFRKAMRRLAGAVHIVTTRDGDELSGLTATAVCSLTANPARILVCVNLQGRSFKGISQSRIMAVNVLGSEHAALATRFATEKNTDLFADTSQWTSAATGAPLLKEALVGFDCTVEQMMITSTHAVVIGDIKHISLREDGQSLLYADGKYMTTSLL